MLRDHLRKIYPDSNVSDWSIVVQIVLNMQGLGTKLQACGVFSNPNELVNFGRAFSNAQPLFSFIDIGSGKERTDHKVRETLRLFLPNAQCKHVFFGPCHDNGYLVVLEPYRLDPAVASRLTLIATTPPAPGFLQLGLPHITFPQIFRSDNLPDKYGTASPFQPTMPVRNKSASMTPSTAPFVPKSPSPAPSGDSSASNSWATIGKTGAASKNINIATKKPPKKNYMMLNVHDERLDEALPDADYKVQGRFKEKIDIHGKNYCNSYHLAGKCKSGEYCEYVHGEPLSPGEKLVLKHKARSLPCPANYTCRNPDCILGHHCMFGTACLRANCRFYDSHGMDMVSVQLLANKEQDADEKHRNRPSVSSTIGASLNGYRSILRSTRLKAALRYARTSLPLCVGERDKGVSILNEHNAELCLVASP